MWPETCGGSGGGSKAGENRRDDEMTEVGQFNLWDVQEVDGWNPAYNGWSTISFSLFTSLEEAICWASEGGQGEIPPTVRFYNIYSGFVIPAAFANMIIRTRRDRKVNWQKEGF